MQQIKKKEKCSPFYKCFHLIVAEYHENNKDEKNGEKKKKREKEINELHSNSRSNKRPKIF